MNNNHEGPHTENIDIGDGKGNINVIGDNTTINYYVNDLPISMEDDSEEITNKGTGFYVETKARNVSNGDKTWCSTIVAKVGDIVEFQMQYRNTSDEIHQSVMVRDILPISLKYIDDSTKLYNDSSYGATARENTITISGINIGSYSTRANAYIRFRAEVIDDNLAEGVNLLYNWGQVQAGATEKFILQDDACVIVNYHKN